MKKLWSLLVILFIAISFSSSTKAMEAPYLDAFHNYEAFLNGVDYYIGEENIYFTSTEVDLRDEYYVSYVIKHDIRNRKTYESDGRPYFIYQSKDTTLNYHFELHLKLKPDQETMTLVDHPNDWYELYLSGNLNSFILIRRLNDQAIPNSEINRIVSLICALYNKTWEMPS
jgi:hypothetical protein